MLGEDAIAYGRLSLISGRPARRPRAGLQVVPQGLPIKQKRRTGERRFLQSVEG
nr:putative integron gene cassette protein [uncultured bacterium]